MKPAIVKLFAAEARIWKKIQVGKIDACWPWIGSRASGYGHLSIDGKFIQATHAAFCLTHGYWPDLQLLHSCDNPPCCNPKHLHEGTQAQNLLERSQRGRAPIGDKHWTHRMPERVATAKRPTREPYKLPKEKHPEIYQRYQSGELRKVLAIEYGVSKSLIGVICARQRECQESTV